MAEIVITLPVPPSANRYWRIARNRIYISAEGKQYRKDVKAIAEQRAITPLVGNVGVTADWFRERRSGDLDNRMKVLWDALQGIAYANDKQIVELGARRFEDKAWPRVEVTVWDL